MFPSCGAVQKPCVKNLPLNSKGSWVDFLNDLNYPWACSQTNIFGACEFPDHIETRIVNGSRP